MFTNPRKFNRQLPNLLEYRKEFVAKGLEIPLPTVPCFSTGLLAELPPPPPGFTGWPWTEETNPAIYKNTEDWTKFSIITPSYNQGRFIEETIRSVLLQNYPNLEYIILDGGSQDEAVEIIKKYEKWLSFWVSDRDRGQAHAINKGLSIITGSFWQWINSDDRYFPNVLQQVALILKSGDYDTFYGGVHESTDDGNISYDRISFNISKSIILDPKAEFNRDFYYKPEASVLSVKLSKELGGFREDFHNIFDTEFMVLYADACQPIYQPVKLIHFRIHELSKTIANFQRIYEEYFIMLQEHHRVGSAKWFRLMVKKAGFLSTRDQPGKNRFELLTTAVQLLMATPWIVISRAYWGLWRKILLGT